MVGVSRGAVADRGPTSSLFGLLLLASPVTGHIYTRVRNLKPMVHRGFLASWVMSRPAKICENSVNGCLLAVGRVRLTLHLMC